MATALESPIQVRAARQLVVAEIKEITREAMAVTGGRSRARGLGLDELEEGFGGLKI